MVLRPMRFRVMVLRPVVVKSGMMVSAGTIIAARARSVVAAMVTCTVSAARPVTRPVTRSVARPVTAALGGAVIAAGTSRTSLLTMSVAGASARFAVCPGIAR